MGIVKIILISVGVIIGAGLIALPTVVSLPHPPAHDALMGNNFFKIRRDALTLFPRGSRLSEAADGLVAIGFRCQGVPHKMPNVNAESLICDSHGRGYPNSQALSITVLARNGLVSDFDVWNMLQRADAETPEPPAAPPPPTVAAAEGKPAKAE